MPENTMIPDSKPQPVLLFMSIMTTITAVVGAFTIAETFSQRTMGIIAVVVAGLNQGVAYYLRGQVVPLADVASYANKDRQMVMGPANEL